MRHFLSEVFQRISHLFVPRQGSFYGEVCFVPKCSPDDPMPWMVFGSSLKEYTRWVPEICGICCLKMVGDTFGVTSNSSLYRLTMQCLGRGGFKIQEDGSIAGVFHHPLVRLAEELGLQGSVERNLDVKSIISHLKNNRLIVLSIDLQKVSGSLKGNHLVLVHRYLPRQHVFLVHDCAFAVGKEGANIPLSRDELARMSNERGMAFWKNRL